MNIRLHAALLCTTVASVAVAGVTVFALVHAGMALTQASTRLQEANTRIQELEKAPAPVVDPTKVCLGWWFGHSVKEQHATRKRLCGK